MQHTLLHQCVVGSRTSCQSCCIPVEMCPVQVALLFCQLDVLREPTAIWVAHVPLHQGCSTGLSPLHSFPQQILGAALPTPATLPACRKHWFWSRVIMTPEQRAAFRKGDLLGAGMGATELTGGRPVTTQVCTHISLISASCASPVDFASAASISH